MIDCNQKNTTSKIHPILAPIQPIHRSLSSPHIAHRSASTDALVRTSRDGSASPWEAARGRSQRALATRSSSREELHARLGRGRCSGGWRAKIVRVWRSWEGLGVEFGSVARS